MTNKTVSNTVFSTFFVKLVSRTASGVGDVVKMFLEQILM